MLDLYITNISSLVKTTTTVTSISDHDHGAIVANTDIDLLSTKKKPRKYFLFAEANWSRMTEDAAKFVESTLYRALHAQGEPWMRIWKMLKELHVLILIDTPSTMTSTRVDYY